MQYFGFDRPSFAFKTYGFGANPDAAILALFTGGKQGVWYDPSDKSTLFQDVAGTVPVTKDGDPVALMKDKSGNGYHATQSVSTARPLYKTDGVLSWFDTDGVDDWFKTNYTPSSDWSSSIAMAIIATATAFVFESFSGAANNYVADGSVVVVAAPSAEYRQPQDFALDTPFVYSARVQQDNVGTVPLAISARYNGTSPSYHTNNKVYGLIVTNFVMSAEQIGSVDMYLAKKSGVTL